MVYFAWKGVLNEATGSVTGYGEGKDEEPSRAIFKATNRAIKNLRYFDRYDNRTISMDIEHKFHATKLELRSRPPGTTLFPLC